MKIQRNHSQRQETTQEQRVVSGKQPTKKEEYVRKQYSVSLTDSKVYTIVLKNNSVVDVFVDTNGTVYPECFRSALEQSILIEK